MRRCFLIVLLLLVFVLNMPAVSIADQRPRETAQVPILLYHHIQELPADASDALRRWSLTPEQFAEHIRWIDEQGFSVINMAQLNDHLQHGTPLPKRPLILTFDDGWKDHYTVVFPLLDKYHFTATFFITTESVGHSAFVAWEDLQKMEAAGMDIQSHSVTHPHLTRLKDAEAIDEIKESKKELESHLKKPLTVFAYPFGNYSDKIIAMVKAAGYESATIVNGSNVGYLYRADRTYTLGRIAIEGDMILENIAQSVEQVENHENNH